MTTFSRKDFVATVFVVLCLGGGALAGCGSSGAAGSGGGDHTSTLTDDRTGKIDGFDVHQFTTPGGQSCVLIDNSYDNNIALSCNWPTPTTQFAP